MYTEKNRTADFNYFIKNYNKLYQKYGHCFLAIRDKTILASKPTLREVLDSLKDSYSIGDYIIQECNGDKSAYTASIMRLMIHA